MAQNLKLARQARRVTQQQVAQAARCSISTVRMAEAGVLPSEAMRRRLARAVGVEPAAIWASDAAPAVPHAPEGA